MRVGVTIRGGCDAAILAGDDTTFQPAELLSSWVISGDFLLSSAYVVTYVSFLNILPAIVKERKKNTAERTYASHIQHRGFLSALRSITQDSLL